MASALLLSAVLLHAQVLGATVSGLVTDADTGAPLAGAVVELPDLVRVAVTDDAGRYELQRVASGPQHLFARLTVDSSYWALLVPMIVSGAGMAMTMTPATAAAMSSVRPDKAGVGSAVLNSARQVGASIGIAVTGAVVASRLTAALALGAPRPVAFVRGMHGGFLFSAASALAGSEIAFATLRVHVGPAVPSTPVGAPIPLE